MEDAKKYLESAGMVPSVAAWAVLLFLLTVLGGLPLLLEGLNFSQISASTPHLSLILAGMLVSACAPTLAALFIAGFYPEAGGVRSVLRQVRTWRVGIVWYALALSGPIVLFLAADAVHVALGGSAPVHWLTFQLHSGLGPGSLFWVVFGSLFAEELGWRGFAQPRLQCRWGALRASILVGILWATWHLWPVITPGGLGLETSEDAAATYIRMISTAIVYSWMYNSTNGSLFLVMMAHFGHNFAGSVVPTAQDSPHFHFTIALLYLAAAVGILWMTDWRTLTRKESRTAASGS